MGEFSRDLSLAELLDLKHAFFLFTYGRLHKMFFYDAPMIFVGLWRIVSPFVVCAGLYLII